jgi:CheY-like chemotaxis protein
MVVDDEYDIRILFEQNFRREIKEGKMQFQFATSGEEALAYLNGGGATDLVLILSDINMPGMSGLELLKRTKENYRFLPVFMITAYDDDVNRGKAESYGADDYLVKPIDFMELKSRISEVMNL